MNKTVLITGAHGFLGRYCAAEFCRQGYRVMGIGHGSWDNAAAAAAGVEMWVEGSITLENLASLPLRPDIIVHAAGSRSVSYSLSNPMQDFESSVTTTLAVLEFARLAAHSMRIVLISSAAVYGSTDINRITEDTPACPTSPYGIHKHMAEQLCSSYRQHFGVESTVIRFFSVFGPGLRKQLLWEACCRMSSAEAPKSLEFFGTGNETRDWLHARDAALLVRLAGEYAHDGLVINGGTGEAISVSDIIERLAAEMGWSGRISFNKIVRNGDPEHLCADCVRSGHLGWVPSVSLSDGLADYTAWFRGSE